MLKVLYSSRFCFVLLLPNGIICCVLEIVEQYMVYEEKSCLFKGARSRYFR